MTTERAAEMAATSDDLHLIRYPNGYRPICRRCGWDDAPHATKSGAEVSFEQHRCQP